MIFLDSNYFLRYLVEPTTPAVRRMAEIARSLFEAVGRGEEEVTTTEVVLHEVIYVLGSKKQYDVPAADIASALSLIIRLPGFRLPPGEKTLYLRALDLYASHPKLGFADAVVAARVERLQIPLATFDGDFDQLPGIQRWPPVTE